MPKRVSVKGKGADLFFGDYPAVPETGTVAAPAAPESQLVEPATATVPPTLSAAPSEPAPDTAPSAEAERKPTPRPSRSRAQVSHDASKLASALAAVDAGTVEAIRQVIKAPGREVSFVRLTPEEKAHLGDIVYTYKRQGQKTSETEINRIAINYLL